MRTSSASRRGTRDSALARYAAAYEAARHRTNAALGIVNAAKLQRADALINSLFERSFDAILVAGVDGRIELTNDAAARLFGLRRGTLTGRSVFDLIPSTLLSAGLPDMSGEISPLVAYHEATGRKANGAEFPIEIGAGVIHVNSERRLVFIVRDITDRKAQEARLQYQALHDALTGLPNRAYLAEQLDQTLSLAERTGQTAALLMLDLDRFKEVNDTLGHPAGDALLCDVARRLRTSMRTSDVVARLGGDEFAAVLPAGSGEDRARRVARRIAESLRDPFTYDGVVIEIGGSIGIALYPEHGREKERLLQCADVAMYAAKESQCGIALYQHDEDRYSVRQLTLASELRRAIDNGQIFLEYQPKLDIRQRRILGLEALARWHHPLYGRIGPDEFVAQAERCGLTQQLTASTVNLALEQLATWRAAGLDLSVAINLSAREMLNRGLPDLLSEKLQTWNVDPASVTIEITESALMKDPDRALEIANTVSEIGCKLSIDDFGTGYSSLSYLSRLPVNELKIDKSFVLSMAHSGTNATIVHSTIDLAHNLGLKVVSEGVETREMLDALVRLGCDAIQGFLIGPPMSAAGVPAWLGSDVLVEALDHLLEPRLDAHAAA
ncbi:MAG: EAL domain-containing protein [Rhodospirillales bacterium]|nr:EAL domain-containing protein [Rhodospirillales bacterium]